MKIDPPDVARYLLLGAHAPDPALAARVDALRTAALDVLRPARTWRRGDLAGWCARSTTLARRLAGCHAVYLACGTLGAGFDALARRTAATSAADALVLQAIGAAAIEEWMDLTEDEIRRELAPDETLVRRYSPGYGDLPLAAQRDLLGFLDAPRTVGVSLTDSLLMVPSKSVSALIGVRKVSSAT